jgi:2-iminobutanoate/2-iminopropanoate deaminase
MTLKLINPPGAFSPTTYHLGVLASGVKDMLFISGQVGMKEDGSVAEGVAAQAGQAMKNMAAVLKAADMDASNVAKYTVFVTDAAHTPEVIQAAMPYWRVPSPAVTLLVVKGLASPALLVEIEAIAVR